MMRFTKRTLTMTLAALAMLAASSGSNVAVNAQTGAQRARVFAPRFSGDVVVGGRTLHVTVADWIVPNGRGMYDIRFGGYTVVQELAGKMQADLNGKRLDVHEGDTFTVPAGALLRARAARSTAIFTAVVTTTGGGVPQPSKPSPATTPFKP